MSARAHITVTDDPGIVLGIIIVPGIVLGIIIVAGGEFEAVTCDGSLGVHADASHAARAVWRHARSDFTPLGAAAATVVADASSTEAAAS